MVDHILGYEYLIDVKQKLQSVLQALKQEHDHNTEFYFKKISELYDEIADKEITIATLQSRLEENEKKIKELQQKTNKRDCSGNYSSCSPKYLHQATTTQQNIKVNSYNYAQIFVDNPFIRIHNNPRKKINISDYFLKLSDDMKTGGSKNKQRENSTLQSFVEQIQPYQQAIRSSGRQKITRRAMHYFSEFKGSNKGDRYNIMNTFTSKF